MYRRLVACTAARVARAASRPGCPAGCRVDVLKNALKAANHKIEELHAALRAQTALQVAHTNPCTHWL